MALATRKGCFQVTNSQVITAWSKGQAARSGNLSTDGHRLYSYALCIGEWRDGLPVVFNYTARSDINPFGHRVASLGFCSQTTSHHVSLARRVGYAFDKDNPNTGHRYLDPPRRLRAEPPPGSPRAATHPPRAGEPKGSVAP